MPCFRGIEVFVCTNSNSRKLPEFPHPEGSSVRLLSNPRLSPLSTPPPSSPLDPTRIQKANPTTSVYVPSLPGAQFWLQYAVLRPPTPQCHVFFKMFMNGRHITSWGIDPAATTSGFVSRAFYEPGDRWHYKQDGVTFKRDGIETRYFHFAPGPEKASVAEDGGLIQVHVFRAKSKKRRAPRLTAYRSQDRYGIASPSGGLLENPEDTTYYDFLLQDPKDSPYATFKFHYRSWTNLRQLSLVPSESRNSIEAQHTPEHTGGDKQCEAEKPFAFGAESLDGTIFESDSSTKPACGGKIYVLRSPPELLSVSLFPRRVPQPSKLLRDNLPKSERRPLPDIPDHEGGLRRASTESHTPSITPSLLQYMEDENDMYNSEEIEYGVATKIELPEKQGERPLPNPLVASSPSDYDTSPPSSPMSQSPLNLKPQAYLATTGSTLERQLSLFSSLSVENSPVLLGRGEIGDADLGLPPMGTIKLTESEWMKSTPSPVRRQHDKLKANRLLQLRREDRMDKSLQHKAGH